MKYQFILNGKVVSAQDLYELDLEFYEFMLDDLLLGKEVELDSFVSENGTDILQLVEVEKEKRKMKLKDLKQGMVGKLRNEESITVVNSRYYFTSSFVRFKLEENYNEDLTHKRYEILDIMEVSFGDEVVFKRNESRWFIPEVGESYYNTNDFGYVVESKNYDSLYDYKILDKGKVFKTREEAEKRVKQQQATLSVERWIAENDVEVDLYDTDVWKFSVYYFVETKKFKVMSYRYYIYTPKQFILSSREKAKQLIKEREKELKIMFGVEDRK